MDIRLTKETVEVFFHGSRVASHPRAKVWLRDQITQPEHMPAEHLKYLSYDADEFIKWAKTIGEYTSKVVEYFLNLARNQNRDINHVQVLLGCPTNTDIIVLKQHENDFYHLALRRI